MATPPESPPLVVYVQIGTGNQQIKGESSDGIYEEMMEALSIQWSVRNTGGAAGRQPHDLPGEEAEFGDFVFTKIVDQATPAMCEACAKGRLFGFCGIHFCTDVGEWNPACYLWVTLGMVIISGVELTGEVVGAGAPRPVERVSLRYSKIYWIYTPIDHTGKKLGASHRAGWDVGKNIPWTDPKNLK